MVSGGWVDVWLDGWWVGDEWIVGIWMNVWKWINDSWIDWWLMCQQFMNRCVCYHGYSSSPNILWVLLALIFHDSSLLGKKWNWYLISFHEPGIFMGAWLMSSQVIIVTTLQGMYYYVCFTNEENKAQGRKPGSTLLRICFLLLVVAPHPLC